MTKTTRLFTNVFAFVLLANWTMNGTAQSTTKLIEKIEKKGNELCIPYEKYMLANGLTLIIHEDHSDPIMHVDVTYHVGSAREQEGRSGFAHFFEHMMFQGSSNVGDDEHFKIISEAGGDLNGTTNTDRTNYFETMPSNQLEVGLWLEADRMGFLLDSVTQPKFEIQRATVKNERGQSYDNKPYGVVGEKTNEALYPYGHPYSWQTIGYIEDLNRVNVNDLKKFFMRWYGPNNATLTVAGDVKPAEVIKLAEKYFGPIPRGPEVKPQPKTPVTLDKDRYISYQDNIRFPMIQFAFPTVANRHPDEAALDVLSDILGGGKNSIFYQNFVKTQIALRAVVNNPCQELAGMFHVNVLTFPTKTLAEMETLIRSSLAQFEKNGATDEDISKFIATYEASLINSVSSVGGKASQLAAYQTFTGTPNGINEELERYKKLTKEDIMRVYKTYIKDKPAVILSVYPKGKPELVAKADNFQVPVRKTDVPESDEYKNLTYNKPKDNFDRSRKPTPGENPVVKVPDFWTESFPNGLKIISAKNDEVPSVTLQLSIEAGHRFENKEKAGIAQLTADILNESTMKHTAEEITVELDKLGSGIGVGGGSEEITLTVSSLKKNLDATLKLAEEILLHPKFDTTEFKLAKNRMLENIANQSTQPTVIANNVYNKLMYGNNNIMSVPSIGNTPTVSTLTIDDVKEYYNKNFSPSISQLVVVGDITREEIIPKIDFLKNWTDKKVIRTPEPALPAVEKTRIYLVNKEKAPQSEIRIGYMALPYDATGDFYKATLMNYNLGGAFNSRINLNLREQKGYTYGAKSRLGGSQFIGSFTASAGVRANATDSSVVEFMKEIKNYSDMGIKPQELEFTKKSIGQSEALEYETASQKAGFLRRILKYNLDKSFVGKQNEILKNITKTEIDGLAKKFLPYEKMNILVIGDKALVYPGLSKLGYEIVELDSDGNMVK